MTPVVPHAAEVTAHVKAARLMVHQTAKEVKQQYRQVQQQAEKIMAEGKQPVANTAKQGAPLVLSAALWTYIVLAAANCGGNWRRGRDAEQHSSSYSAGISLRRGTYAS